ncbi:hypothetical protein KKB18_09135 [bacterium]|nr:hypothetical protein [bacterium]
MISGIFDSSIMGMQRTIAKYDSIVKGGEDSALIHDMVDMIKVSSEFKANTKSIKVADEMFGTIINIKV